MRKDNLLFLGIGIAYIAMAITQFFKPQLFPMALYMTIAWASLSLSLFELFKSLLNIFHVITKLYEDIISSEKSISEREISVLQKYQCFNNQIEQNKELLSFLESKNSIAQGYRKKEKALEIIEKVMTVIEIASCCAMFAMMPLKVIPNDLQRNKELGVLSLLSFALIFVSYYVRIRFDADSQRERLMSKRNQSNYYLDLMEKMSEDKTDNT